MKTKVKLSANSIEATEFLEKKHGVNCSHSYSYGFGENDELKKEQSWGLKAFSTLDKLFSKANPLPEEDRVVATEISNSAKLLEQALLEEDHEHIKGMQIAMSLPSKFNSVVTKVVDKLHDYNAKLTPQALLKMRNGSRPDVAAINPYSQKMIISSEMFTNPETNNFVPGIIEKIGLEETIKYVIYHEASHAFEKTNIRKHGEDWNSNVSPILEIARHYDRKVVQDEELENTIDVLNSHIIKNKLDFDPLDKEYLKEISVLHSEIYADVGSILLNRNLDVAQGRYSKERIHHFIDTISEARFNEQQRPSNMVNRPASYFNHFTTPGLDRLKDIIDHIPERMLDQKEISYYANECASVGLARIIIATTITEPERTGQLRTIFHTSASLFDNSLELSDVPDNDLVMKRYNALKEAAGLDWFKQYIADTDLITKEGLVNNQLYWLAGVNRKEFEKELPKFRALKKELDHLFSEETSPPKVEIHGGPISPSSPEGEGHLTAQTVTIRDKNSALSFMDKIRNKSLNNNPDSPTLKRTI